MKPSCASIAAGAVVLGCAAAPDLRAADDIIDPEALYTFTSPSGEAIAAKIASAVGDTVKIIREDGRPFTVPASVFTEDDRKHIRAWKKHQDGLDPDERINRAAKIDISVSPGKIDKNAQNGDYDDRRETLSFTMKIENRELKATFTKLAGTLVVFGKSVVDRDNFKILSIDNFKMAMAPGQAHSIEGSPVTCMYDDNAAAKYGYSYDGWAVVLQDEDGNIVAYKANKVVQNHDPRTILAVKKGAYYDRSFEKTVDGVRDSRY